MTGGRTEDRPEGPCSAVLGDFSCEHHADFLILPRPHPGGGARDPQNRAREGRNRVPRARGEPNTYHKKTIPQRFISMLESGVPCATGEGRRIVRRIRVALCLGTFPASIMPISKGNNASVNRPSGPDFGRTASGEIPKSALRPPLPEADFGAFPVAVRPKSGPEGRFPDRKHYCVTSSTRICATSGCI